jgi:hypothetical protein
MSFPFSWQIIRDLLARFSSSADAGKTPVADDNGKIADGWINFPAPPVAYVLPAATASVLGGVKVGTGLSVSNGVLSFNSAVIGFVPGLNFNNIAVLGYNVSNFTLPAGGTWAVLANYGGNGSLFAQYAAKGVFAGGTTITIAMLTPGEDYGFRDGQWAGHAIRIA